MGTDHRCRRPRGLRAQGFSLGLLHVRRLLLDRGGRGPHPRGTGQERPGRLLEDSVIRILDRVPVYATRVKMLLCEIDSLSDALSLGLLTPDELADQCSETQMAEKLKGLTNDTYHIQLDGKGLVLRIPGQGTDQIIDRSVEAAMLEMVKDLDITPECHFYAGGIKTTDFLEGYRILNHDTLDQFEVRGVVDIMRRLHGHPHARGLPRKSTAPAPCSPCFPRSSSTNARAASTCWPITNAACSTISPARWTATRSASAIATSCWRTSCARATTSSSSTSNTPASARPTGTTPASSPRPVFPAPCWTASSKPAARTAPACSRP